MNEDLKDFLTNYDNNKYQHPSVTVDVLVFAINNKNEFCVLMTKRNEMPFKNQLALPGSFVGINEGLEDTVYRIFKSKLDIETVGVEQLYTFGDVNRDPRTRVISIAYWGFLSDINKVEENDNHKWINVEEVENMTDIAFDHKDIIRLAVNRLRNKINYSSIALGLVKDYHRFTIHELKTIHEAILDKKLDTANFRKMFNNKFVREGIVIKTGEKCHDFARASDYYTLADLI